MRQQLYRRLRDELQKRLVWASKPQVQNLALLTQALVFTPNCHLSNLALELPIAGQRESLIQRLERFLDNTRVCWRVHYRPLVRQLLTEWPDDEINLIMDRTDIGQESSILFLGLAFKHRTIPLTWRVLPFGGTGEAIQTQLLQEVHPCLPPDKRVLFYGDSEFRAIGLQRYCRQQGWGWQVGVKSDTLFHQGDGDWQPLRTLTVLRGGRRYVHDLTLTQRSAWPAVHLIVDWTHDWKTPRYVICHQPTNGRSWRRGRKRFWIEPTFRDWKSYGFDLECSQITDPQRLHRLLLGMALATLWLLLLGQWLQHTGRQQWLTAAHRRDFSLFRLARDYARRSQLCNWELPICLQR